MAPDPYRYVGMGKVVSNYASPNGRDRHVVGIDLGGSQVRVALADTAGHAVADASAPTEKASGAALLAQVRTLSRDLADRAGAGWSTVAGAAVGVPGVVAPDGGRLRLAPNLPSLGDGDAAAAFAEALDVPVAVDNDVNLATLAEQRHGAGAALDDFVFIAVGTGVGMGIVAGGTLVHGATGAAGEIGFLPLGGDPYDPASHAHGALEDVVGGAGLARRYAARTGDTAATAVDVFDRAEAGEPDAGAVLEDQARSLALGIASVTSTLDPAVVVLGGGIGSRPDVLRRVRDRLAAVTARQVPIVPSTLGPRAGLLGAIELARTHFPTVTPKQEGARR
jgi:predicted NBD/HSP70 family sugar kinase